MKLFVTLSLFLNVACVACLGGTNCRPSFRANLKRTIRNAADEHGQGLHSALERLMRTRLLQYVSTYYAVIFSEAETLSEVNKVLTSGDTVQTAVRDIRQELYIWEEGDPDRSVDFRTPDGHLAASVHVYNRNLELENLQTVVRVYITWLYFTNRLPQAANIEIMLE